MSSAKSKLGLHISTYIVVAACFSVVCGALVVGQNLKKILTLWGDDIQMTVYLSQDLSAEDREKLETDLSRNDKIGRIHYVSRENALQEFRGQLANYAPDILHDDDLLHLIPSSFQLSLSQIVPVQQQLDALNEIAKNLKARPGIDEVSYGQDWVKKYSSLVAVAENIFFILGIVILAASVLVISNAIRSSISSRRDEIEVLELIGATPWMIRKPYFIEGAIIGFFSAAGGTVICFLIFNSAMNLLKSDLGFLQLSQHMSFLSFTAIIALLGFGAAFGAIGAYLSVRGINDGWAASSR